MVQDYGKRDFCTSEFVNILAHLWTPLAFAYDLLKAQE